MIEEPPLLTISAGFARPTADQIAAFRGIPASMVTDAMFGTGSLSGAITPLTPDMQAVGPALTADCQPGDILPILACLKFIQPGDIVVAAYQGHQGSAAAGDRVSGMITNAGAAGFVTDGPMRDADGILATGLPCWCTGLTPASPVSTGPGRVGTPVQIAGQQVCAGDLIVADRDGVVVVPHARIDEVAAQVQEVLALETALDARVSDGLALPQEIDDLLASDRVRYLE